MMAPDFTRPGIWQELLAQALRLTDHLSDVVRNPSWSFGGGTVLMLRLNHRFSKDIDLFVPDPQYLATSRHASRMSPRPSPPSTKRRPRTPNCFCHRARSTSLWERR